MKKQIPSIEQKKIFGCQKKRVGRKKNSIKNGPLSERKGSKFTLTNLISNDLKCPRSFGLNSIKCGTTSKNDEPLPL